MKTGIFSDVHGNLEALEAVLAAMTERKVERHWCLGDLVGYCANPNECVARVRQAAEAVVRGNHDAACTGGDDIASFNQFARQAILWTIHHLEDGHKEWLKNLPMTVTRDDILLVHASPRDPGSWHYIHNRMRVGEMVRAFSATQARLIFVGHSHQPMILVQKGEEYYRFLGDRIKIEADCRYLVNVGSSGQPRDGNPQASYVIYDPAAGTVAIERVPYDITVTKRKIREAGLPEMLAERLDAGS